MPLRHVKILLAFGIFLATLACSLGCRSAESGGATAQLTPVPPNNSLVATTTETPIPAGGAVPAAFQTLDTSVPPLAPSPPETAGRCDDDPFAGQSQLEPDALVAAVIDRNPSLAAMSAAWQADAERYPQAVSLDDPMLSMSVAPASIGSTTNDVGWIVRGSQKIPWSGKRDLRGEQAEAGASAARLDLADAEIRLVAAARVALWDYYLVRRQKELNAENRVALKGFRDTAQAKYRAAQVTQQDVLAADVELAEIERREFELNRMESVAIARINTLLHRSADHPLPPPRRPRSAQAAPPVVWLQQLAVERRPDLAAIGAELRAEQAAVELAERDYYPDLEVFGLYNGNWQGASRQLAPMVGVNMNVPLDNARRQAAVREASARVEQRRWQYEAKLDEIHSEVQIAYARLTESDKTLALYRQTILPAAGQYLEAARGNYTANTLDFLHLIDAERRLIQLREQYEVALAERERRGAELQEAAGGAWPQAAGPEAVPTPPGKEKD